MKIFEVDAAANRIREEVDMDANVIFGATQDESLEGIIRVSVVATGLDQAQRAAEAGEPQMTIDQRLAMMADRLRAQMAARSAAQASFAQNAAPAQPVAEPQVAETPVMPAFQPVVEAPQPALAHREPDVVVAPAAPRQTFFAQPVMDEPVMTHPEPVMEEAFIPPQPERIARPQRMPTMEELPLPGQAMLQAQRSEAVAAPPPPEAKRMSLMQRLAAVGFGRPKDEAAQEELPPAPAMEAAPLPAPHAQPSATHALYGRRPTAAQPAAAPYRPAQGQLDAQGRIPAPVRSFEDDQLEIPAFLRRQAK
jgi:cell division protein FtsZ